MQKILLHAALMMAGFTLSGAQLWRLQVQQTDQVVLKTISGCIVSLIEAQDRMIRFEFEPLGQSFWQVKARYRVSWFNTDAQPEPGSCWQLTLRLRAPRGTLNHIGFDYERWLFSRRITAIASVKAGRSNKPLAQRHVSRSLLALRKSIYHRIQLTTRDYSSGPLLGALAVGSRHGLSDDVREVLKRSGLAHLLAISGLHIGLAAGIGYAVMRWLPPPGVLYAMACRFAGLVSRLTLAVVRTIFGRSARKTSPMSSLSFHRLAAQNSLHQRGLLGALLVGTFYAALAGFSVTTVRALIMLIIWTIWRWHRRRTHVLFVALLTVAILSVGAPHTLAGTSFWMSCGAVLVLGWIAQSLKPGNGWRARLRQAVQLQWGILVLMLPLTSSVAGGFSVMALPCNLILIPLFGFVIVPLLLLALVLMALNNWAAEHLLRALAWGLDVLWQVIAQVSTSDFAFVSLPTWTPWLLAPIIVVGWYSFYPMGWPLRRCIFVGALPLFLSTATCSTTCLRPGEFRLDVLDTGQALSVVITTHQQVVVYDAGDIWPGGDSAERVLVPWLDHQRIDALNHLVVSHADSDHAGGVSTLLQHYRPEHSWVGERVAGLVPARACREGVRWQADGVWFSFLYPRSPVTAQGNRQSCVLRVDGANSSVLLTGDLDAFGELQLIAHLREAPVDLVIGAHHGSMTSSAPAFIKAAGARWVVFSNGADNQWGMPRDAVVRRWELQSTRVLTTAELGQISFLSQLDEPLELTSTARGTRRGAWRQP